MSPAMNEASVMVPGRTNPPAPAGEPPRPAPSLPATGEPPAPPAPDFPVGAVPAVPSGLFSFPPPATSPAPPAATSPALPAATPDSGRPRATPTTLSVGAQPRPAAIHNDSHASARLSLFFDSDIC